MEQLKRLAGYIHFLTGELHSEWERTGATKASIAVTKKEERLIAAAVARQAQEVQEAARKDSLTFKAGIRKSKESYVLIRLARKVAEGRERAEKAGGTEFFVELDKEEYRMFRWLVKENAQAG